MDVTLTLTDEQLAAIAAQVAELLPAPEPLEPLLTVADVAALLGVDEEWVRRHQAELGAIKLGTGAGRSPVRFSRDDIERFISDRRQAPTGANWRSDPDWAMG